MGKPQCPVCKRKVALLAHCKNRFCQWKRCPNEDCKAYGEFDQITKSFGRWVRMEGT